MLTRQTFSRSAALSIVLCGGVLAIAFLLMLPHGLAALPSVERRCGVNSLADSANWTPQERWVFGRICAGQVADLVARYPTGASKEAEWPQRRILTPRFLETILLKEPYRSLIPRNGVRISGARFDDKVDLAGAQIACTLRIDDSLLDKGLDFSNLRTEHTVSLESSSVIGKARMDGLQTRISLWLQKAKLTDVSLMDAEIGRDLNLKGAIITGDLDMETMHVGGIVLATGGRFAGVNLSGVKVDDQLVMDESVVNGKLNMQDVQVGHSLLMRETQLNGNAQFLYAKVGGQLDFSGYQVEPNDPTCGGGATEKPKANFKGGSLPGVLDLTGARIGAALLFGSCKRRAPRWQTYSWLILRNVSVGALQDRNEDCTVLRSDCREAWPQHLLLDGLAYEQLSALNSGNESNMASRGSDWWISWLARQQKYSPQPYQQTASVLRKLGYPEDADSVLYAGKNRELREAKYPTKIWLFLLWIFIGYGYRLYYAGLWALFFVVFGAIVLRVSGEGHRNGMPYGLTYSFDMLLPLVKLRERDSTIELHGLAAYYFYIHKVIGLALGSFLLAGLSGLTK